MKKVFLPLMAVLLLASCEVPTYDTSKLVQDVPESWYELNEYPASLESWDLESDIESILDGSKTLETLNTDNSNIDSYNMNSYFYNAASIPTEAIVSFDLKHQTYGVYSWETTDTEKKQFTIGLTITEVAPAILPTYDGNEITDYGTPAIYKMVIAEDTRLAQIEYEVDSPSEDDTQTIIDNLKVCALYDCKFYDSNDIWNLDWHSVPATFEGTITNEKTEYEYELSENFDAGYVFPRTEPRMNYQIWYAIKAKNATNWGDPVMGKPSAKTLEGYSVSLDIDNAYVGTYKDCQKRKFTVPGLDDISDSNKEDYEGLEYKIWYVK